MTKRENQPSISVRVKCGREPDVVIAVHGQYGHDPALVHMLLHLALFSCESRWLWTRRSWYSSSLGVPCRH
jgi:hypothetical protein